MCTSTLCKRGVYTFRRWSAREAPLKQCRVKAAAAAAAAFYNCGGVSGGVSGRPWPRESFTITRGTCPASTTPRASTPRRRKTGTCGGTSTARRCSCPWVATVSGICFGGGRPFHRISPKHSFQAPASTRHPSQTSSRHLYTTEEKNHVYCFYEASNESRVYGVGCRA